MRFAPRVAVFFIAAAFLLPSGVHAAVLARPANNLGLAAYWPFNEGAGTIAGDTSGNKKAGTLTGGTWSAGKREGALSFNGSSDKVVGSSITMGTSMTISAWVKKTASTGQKSFFSNRGGGNVYFGLTGTQVFFYDTAGSPAAVTSGSGAIQIGQWQHVVATSNGSTATLYVNGAQVYQTSQTRTASTGTFGIGWDPNLGTEYWDGSIDDVRIYNRVLSPDEIAGLYSGGAGRLNVRTPGLSGKFYDDITLTAYVSSAIDSTINFNPADTPLGVNRSNGGDTFSARWTGYVKADYSETYTFYTTSDDGVRLYVNNQNVVDSWIDQGPTEHSGTIALQAGQWYPIRLEFYENGGGSVITMSYSSASVSKAIIPASNLSHGLGGVTINASSASLTTDSSLKSGLVGLWTFDGPDTTDKIYDRSGSGNNGYLNSGAATSSVKTIGKLGQALQFNGSMYVDVGNSTILNPTNAISFSAWMNTSVLSSYHSLIERRTAPNAGGWIFDIYGSYINMFINNGAWSACAGGTTLATNTWYYVTGTYDGSNMKVYVNGVLDNSCPLTGSIAVPSTDTLIGYSYYNAAQSWNGKLDDVRIYDRALSAAEVKQLYLLGQ